MSLQPVTFARVQRFARAAAGDHVSISDTAGTRWFLWTQGEDTIGVCALMQVRAGYRIKGVWIKPEHRRHGHGTTMTMALIAYASDELMAPRLEALAHNPGFYEGMGWSRTGATAPNGAVWVERRL